MWVINAPADGTLPDAGQVIFLVFLKVGTGINRPVRVPKYKTEAFAGDDFRHDLGPARYGSGDDAVELIFPAIVFTHISDGRYVQGSAPRGDSLVYKKPEVRVAPIMQDADTVIFRDKPGAAGDTANGPIPKLLRRDQGKAAPIKVTIPVAESFGMVTHTPNDRAESRQRHKFSRRLQGDVLSPRYQNKLVSGKKRLIFSAYHVLRDKVVVDLPVKKRLGQRLKVHSAAAL